MPETKADVHRVMLVEAEAMRSARTGAESAHPHSTAAAATSASTRWDTRRFGLSLQESIMSVFRSETAQNLPRTCQDVSPIPLQASRFLESARFTEAAVHDAGAAGLRSQRPEMSHPFGG